jgi:hypothetical protein
MKALLCVVLGFAAGWLHGRARSGRPVVDRPVPDWRAIFRNGERGDRL